MGLAEMSSGACEVDPWLWLLVVSFFLKKSLSGGEPLVDACMYI